MTTAQQAFNRLPARVQAEAVVNARKYEKDLQSYLDKDVSNCLAATFLWSDSREGFAYWEKVNIQFQEYYEEIARRKTQGRRG